MDILESLENLNVSEECFDEIIGIVEEYISEGGNLLKIAAKHGASRNLKKRAYEQPSDTDGYGYYDEERGPMSVQAPPKGRSNSDTKNLKGQQKTDLRHSSYGELLDLKRERDAKNGYKDAIKKSVERHEKKNEVSESLYNEIADLVEEYINEVSAEKIQGTANQRAYDAGKAGSFQFNYGLKTQKGKKSLAKLAKFKDLLNRRENRTREQAVDRNEMQDSHDKGWKDAKDIMEK